MLISRQLAMRWIGCAILIDDHGSVLTCHIGPRAGGDFWELNPIHPLGELN